MYMYMDRIHVYVYGYLLYTCYAYTCICVLRAKNPEPIHPARDSITHSPPPLWPQKADTGAWWENEEGQEKQKRPSIQTKET